MLDCLAAGRQHADGCPASLADYREAIDELTERTEALTSRRAVLIAHLHEAAHRNSRAARGAGPDERLPEPASRPARARGRRRGEPPAREADAASGTPGHSRRSGPRRRARPGPRSALHLPAHRSSRHRLCLPFKMLSDPALALAGALDLPTFELGGMTLYKRLTLIIRDRAIEHARYPIFPPKEHAQQVLTWLRGNPPR
ncbi:hypothetical protein [Saccharopolyspora hattusasensis]|uniref:hypothetical protein n=1 Tax=Saccharopolyspora hattusasensis TaxID=1128679 RepID=UPI003D96512D